jgi:lipopolysaccharide assembly protein A
MMRFLSGLFLVVLVAGLVLLAYENNRDTVVNAWSWQADVSLPLLIGGAYLLGMLSGWWLVGMVKRSWRRVTEHEPARA